MFIKPDDTFKPLLWMAWVGIIAIMLVGVLFGSYSLQKAGRIAVISAFLIFLWNTGAFRYLYYLNVTTSFPVQLKGVLIAYASSYAYPATLSLVFFVDYSKGDYAALTLTFLSFLSFFWMLVLFRRIRLIDDTPSTRLNSAAQGYVELEGQVALYDGEIVRGPGKDFPIMVWYRKYFLTSSAGFILDDSKGRCTIDPRDAEVITPLYHYIGIFYRAIYPHESIYALGYLETLSNMRTEDERNSLVRHKLVSWKRNQFKFLGYFDKNNDGQIDEVEMRTANQAAEKLVDSELEDVYLEPATHTISVPEDGRPFLLSSIHPDKLIFRYKLALVFHFIAWLSLIIFALII